MLVAACTSTTVVKGKGSGSGTGTSTSPTSAEAAGIGGTCVAACGSGDDRKCSMPSTDCPGNLCLVDPTQPIEHLTYCTIDCSASDAACPAGWHCEGIEAFENDSVTRACVANPASCGDGIVELGEACDGDSAAGKCSADCQTLSGNCGDGIVQPDEVCDGDTAAGYCQACKKIVGPQIAITGVQASATAYIDAANGYANLDSTTSINGALPSAGDAQGCGALKVVEQTSELLRFTVKVCDADASMTWTIALPLAATSNISSLDTNWTAEAAKWQATGTLVQKSSGKTYDFEGSWGDEFSQRMNTYAEPGVASYERQGSFLINYGSVGETWASITFNFDLVPPTAP
jgi:hypothetical protein